MMYQRNSGVKVLMIKCTQDQITCRRCLPFCLDFAKEELHLAADVREMYHMLRLPESD